MFTSMGWEGIISPTIATNHWHISIELWKCDGHNLILYLQEQRRKKGLARIYPEECIFSWLMNFWSVRKISMSGRDPQFSGPHSWSRWNLDEQCRHSSGLHSSTCLLETDLRRGYREGQWTSSNLSSGNHPIWANGSK